MHSVWAVATNTLRQALRMKIAVVFIVLLVVLLPVMGGTMTGDGTMKGRLQAFVSYSLSITSFMPQYFSVDDDVRTQLDNEFFAARAGLVPTEADISREVLDDYNKYKKEGSLRPNVSRAKTIEQITLQKKVARRRAAIGQEVVWDFHDVKPLDPNQRLFLRFKYEVVSNPSDVLIAGRWFAGDIRQIEFETPIYTFERTDVIRTFHEIEIPADAVSKDGYLAVGFWNDPQVNSHV